MTQHATHRKRTIRDRALALAPSMLLVYYAVIWAAVVVLVALAALT